MANFPQQVSTEELSGALKRFYNEKNAEIEDRLGRYQRESVSGATDGENMSEIRYNNSQLKKAFRRLENGETKVEVEWYEPVINRKRFYVEEVGGKRSLSTNNPYNLMKLKSIMKFHEIQYIR